ncbi:MAG TPA: hypothetical protein VF729_02765 [Solirubrobacterales bacterium]
MVQSGTSTTLASRTISPPEEMPRPIRAIASGSPAATSEPKAIRRTMAAPRKPIPSGLAPSCAR